MDANHVGLYASLVLRTSRVQGRQKVVTSMSSWTPEELEALRRKVIKGILYTAPFILAYGAWAVYHYAVQGEGGRYVLCVLMFMWCLFVFNDLLRDFRKDR